jgi:hypothetical protein
MLDLSNTTLLFVETRAHKITERVIADCLAKADFGDVVLFTDKPDLIRFDPDRRARTILCEDFPNKKLAGRFYYCEAMQEVTTDFALMLEWDAGIYDVSKWRPEFMAYDYIGAPWKLRPGDPHDVGNGGFTLMSKRLGHRLCMDRRLHPVYTDMDVCRLARARLEPEGFTWASADLAGKFSWELLPRDPEHFGFHGAFNWPTVLPKDEVVARAKLMLKTEYLTIKLRDVIRTAPWIIEHFTPEEMAYFAEHVPPGHMLKPRIPGMMSAQQRAAMQLMQVQRRGFVSRHQRPNQGLKA